MFYCFSVGPSFFSGAFLLTTRSRLAPALERFGVIQVYAHEIRSPPLEVIRHGSRSNVVRKASTLSDIQFTN